MQNGPIQSGSQFLPVDAAKDLKDKNDSAEGEGSNSDSNADDSSPDDEKPFDLDKVEDLEKSKQETKESND